MSLNAFSLQTIMRLSRCFLLLRQYWQISGQWIYKSQTVTITARWLFIIYNFFHYSYISPSAMMMMMMISRWWWYFPTRSPTDVAEMGCIRWRDDSQNDDGHDDVVDHDDSQNYDGHNDHDYANIVAHWGDLETFQYCSHSFFGFWICETKMRNIDIT